MSSSGYDFDTALLRRTFHLDDIANEAFFHVHIILFNDYLLNQGRLMWRTHEPWQVHEEGLSLFLVETVAEQFVQTYSLEENQPPWA